jgi:RNA polymerase sigma factor (sigma-70 family)
VSIANTFGLDRTSVCERYKPLVEHTINKLGISGYEREDALQEGMVGLQRAYDRFDRSRGVDFAVFARPHVRGAILRGIMPKPKSVRLVLAGDFYDVAQVDEQRGRLRRGGAPLGDPDLEAAAVEILVLNQWLESLAPRDGWIIWRRYFHGATTAEIAVEINATPHWVNERHRILIQRAKAALAT